MDKSVLIIDDDQWIAMSTTMVLEAEGFTVHSALSGPEGIDKARAIRPGVILLDIMMPGMDGWETLERLKADGGLTAVPVIVFTAREHREGRSKAQDLGAVDYFRKPFRPDALVQTIRRHLAATSTSAS
jgi:two-component system OmpR family response regulator